MIQETCHTQCSMNLLSMLYTYVCTRCQLLLTQRRHIKQYYSQHIFPWHVTYNINPSLLYTEFYETEISAETRCYPINVPVVYAKTKITC